MFDGIDEVSVEAATAAFGTVEVVAEVAPAPVPVNRSGGRHGRVVVARLAVVRMPLVVLPAPSGTERRHAKVAELAALDPQHARLLGLGSVWRCSAPPKLRWLQRSGPVGCAEAGRQCTVLAVREETQRVETSGHDSDGSSRTSS
ncbi:hypothetical protein [Streptomyces parvus]|uniref:hypothetical protein n=1 Tax=Streptomyces parvus TaxID=66428 RepID=UPI0037122C80